MIWKVNRNRKNSLVVFAHVDSHHVHVSITSPNADVSLANFLETIYGLQFCYKVHAIFIHR